MAGVWVCGGLLFRILEEERDPTEPEGGWPALTILIPAFNEEGVIAANVHAARALDYPDLHILVLDDGSTDATVEAATAAAEGDARVAVVRDPVNRGKAERLNLGLGQASVDGAQEPFAEVGRVLLHLPSLAEDQLLRKPL